MQLDPASNPKVLLGYHGGKVSSLRGQGITQGIPCQPVLVFMSQKAQSLALLFIQWLLMNGTVTTSNYQPLSAIVKHEYHVWSKPAYSQRYEIRAGTARLQRNPSPRHVFVPIKQHLLLFKYHQPQRVPTHYTLFLTIKNSPTHQTPTNQH